MMRSIACCALVAALLIAALLVGACGDKASTVPQVEEGEPSDVSTEYEVVLANAISDTLRGNATFGRVYNPQENTTRLVIRLRSSFDFAGGVVISRKSDELPEEGTYDLKRDSLKLASGDQFVIMFREGMLHDLRSVAGSLTLSSVTDTLIVGEFNATLRGHVSGGRRELEEGEVHALGRFQAERGLSGYVIGL